MKRPAKIIVSYIAALAVALSIFPVSATALDTSLPSLWREYEDYFIMGTFGGWTGAQAMHHYRTNSPSNALKLDSQIGSSNMNSLSRQAYVASEAAINAAGGGITDAQKRALLKAANENVVLVAAPGSINTLNQIRAYNATVPDSEKKVVRAHVLVWHGGQQPNYFFCDGFYYDDSDRLNHANLPHDWASPETMKARLESYIKQMMERYAPYDDIIYSWDVVNEPIDDFTGQIRNMEGYQNGQWGRIFRRADLDGDPDARLRAESVFVRYAFEFARKWSLYYGADWKLYINDFQDSNKPYEPKMSQTIKMMRMVEEDSSPENVHLPPDTPGFGDGLIDGYGMQARLAYAYPTIDMLRAQLEAGLTVADEISFSESDIRSDFIPNPDYDPALPSPHVRDRGADPDLDWPVGSGSKQYQTANNGNTFDTDNSPVKRDPVWTPGSTDGNFALREEVAKAQADFAADWMDLLIEYKDKIVAYQWDGTSDSGTFNRNVGAHLWSSGNTGTIEKPSFFAVIGAPNRDKMRQAIERGPDVTPEIESLYSRRSWAAYTSARGTAEDLVDVRIYDMDAVTDVKEATAELNAAIDGLEPRTTGTYVEINSPKRLGLKVGDSLSLDFDTDGNDYEFVSSNPGIVEIDDDGVMKAKRPGSAAISVRLDESGLAVGISVVVAPAGAPSGP